MAYVYPFIGTRYNTRQVDNLDNVVAPPYDCISPVMQDELYERHNRNFVRIIFGKEVGGDDEFSNRYSRAANLLQEWRGEQTLIDDPKQSYYLYQQAFETPDGQKLSRRGFFGLVRLQGYGAGRVRAHEHTFKGPKADRYRLLRATQFNLSPVFVLYEDPDRSMSNLLAEIADSNKASDEFDDRDRIGHRLWVVQQKEALRSVSEAMRDRELLIADGHHRFETALHYRNEMRRASGQKGGRLPSDYLMMYLVSMADPGLCILPTHRALADEVGVGVDENEVIEDLKEVFKVEPHQIDLRRDKEGAAKMLLDRVHEEAEKTMAMAMVLPGGRAFVLSLKRNVKPASLFEGEETPPAIADLDVTLLHSYLIPNVWIGNPEIDLDEDEIYYTRDAVEALSLIQRRKACVAFLMNPPRIEQVVACAREGLRMPHKSTYFYPKVISGLVMREMRALGG